jgi:glycosyltransferase involved in cell wall biosynthesis
MRQDTQRVLEEVRPDLVHLNSLTIAPLAVYLGRMGIPVVLHVREAVVKGTFGIRRWWLRNLIMQHVKHTIYICKDNEDALTGSIPASSVIYNPISFDKFDKELKAEDLKKSLSIPENALVLLFPGGSSLEPKGLYTFLKALLRIRQVHKHVFTIIPKFSLSEYRDRIDSYMSNDAGYDMGELSKAIISAPFTSNVEEYYAVSDIVVAPFIVPHFSRAVIEAGAMARAVVGSRIGGIEEVVTDGVNGLLVEPDNAYDLEDKLLQLIESPLLRKKMGLRGHALAVKRYQASSHSDKVMDIYDSISS